LSLAWAYGDWSFATGFGTASGDGSSALSVGSSLADFSFAASGGTTELNALYGTALSRGIAKGDNSFAVGGDSVVESGGSNSAALVGGKVFVPNSFAVGPDSIAGIFSSHETFAIGVGAKADIGVGAKADFWTRMALGIHNKIWDYAEPVVLVVGNGTSENTADQSNALIVKESGQTVVRNKSWASSNPTLVGNAGYADEAMRVEGNLVTLGDTVLGSPDNPNSATLVNGDAFFENAVNFKGEVTIESAQGDISMGVFGN